MPMPPLPWTGHCLCGRIGLKVRKPPVLAMACHCRGCQRLSASAFSLTLPVLADSFEVTDGEPVIGALHGTSRYLYCPSCLNWLYTLPAGLDQLVFLRPTMLEDMSWFSPFVETMTDEKLPWAKTPAKHSYRRWPDNSDYDMLMRDYAAQMSTK